MSQRRKFGHNSLLALALVGVFASLGGCTRQVPPASVGIKFNGEEKTNVDEYCVSEGWVRLAVGKAVDRKGNAMTIKLNGVVEPYFKSEAAAEE